MPMTLPLITRLLTRLNAERVGYCHWKSNNALSRSASGENDLDLLVNRESFPSFVAILAECGFKEAQLPTQWQIPGVIDFYGYDETADRIVHAHVHTQLIVGHDYSKNHRVPVENPYVGSSTQDGLFRVPSPDFELVLFVIRMMLKHATWESSLIGDNQMSTSERKELEFLQDRTQRARVHELLARHVRWLDVGVFDECLDALQPGRPALARVLAAHRLMKSMKANQRYSRIRDVSLRVWRRYYLGLRWRVLHKERGKRRLARGGALIALVGGDGSGKTTCADGLQRWIEPYFETRRIHMGKPKRSFLAVLGHGILKIGRTLHLYPYVRSAIDYRDPESGSFPGYPWLIRQVLTSRDRSLTYRKARRLANNGVLVISDRFPLPRIELMDGTAERILAPHMNRRPVKYLAGAQTKYYERIGPPDVLMVLRLDPETAVLRKTDEDPESVRARAAEVWRTDWTDIEAHVIDVGGSKEEVLSLAKQTVWSNL